MHDCGMMRLLTLTSLAFGLIASGALSLAVATDYWLYTAEPLHVPVPFEGTNETMDVTVMVTIHSGLWRACTYYAELEEDEQMPSQCTNIGYFQSWERVDGADTTNSILRAIRKASPVIVLALLVLLLALSLSTLGNAKQDGKTLVGAVFYVVSALSLAVGVIFYISAVNDEVSHRKPQSLDDPKFTYFYGWAFFFAGSSFICSMIAAVANISLYLRRFSNLEDMVMIIPGLDKKSNYDFSSKSEDLEIEVGTQNPTIIL